MNQSFGVTGMDVQFEEDNHPQKYDLKKNYFLVKLVCLVEGETQLL